MSATHVLWRLHRGAAAAGLAVVLSAPPAAALLDGTAPAATGHDAVPVVQAQASAGAVSAYQVPAPDLFEATGMAVWDGNRTLQGVWVAHPSATSARRVRIFNTESGTAVDGALFKRDPALIGPAVLISSEAAQFLGMSPGDETSLRIVALTPAQRARTAETAPDGEAATAHDPGPAPAPAGQAAAEPAVTASDVRSPDAVEPEVTEPATAGPEQADLAAPATADGGDPSVPASWSASAPGTGTMSAGMRIPAPRPVPPATAMAVVSEWPASPETVLRPPPTHNASIRGVPTSEKPAAGSASADAPVDSAAAADAIADDAPGPRFASPAEPSVGSIAIAPTRPVFQAPPSSETSSSFAIVELPRPTAEPELFRAAPVPAVPEPAAPEATTAEAAAAALAAVEAAAVDPGSAEAAPATLATVQPAAPATSQAEPFAPEPAAPAPAATEPAAATPTSPGPATNAAVPDAPREQIVRADPEASGWAAEIRHSAAASPLSQPYVQAGIFGVGENATRLIGRIEAAELPALAKPMTLNGRPAMRVLAGPFSAEDERDAALRTIRGMGLTDATPVAR